SPPRAPRPTPSTPKWSGRSASLPEGVLWRARPLMRASRAAKTGGGRSEQRQLVPAEAPQGVVVDLDPGDVPRRGEDAGLRLHRLRGEDAPHRPEPGVEVQALQIAAELLDAGDLAGALDLDRHHPAL